MQGITLRQNETGGWMDGWIFSLLGDEWLVGFST